MNRHQRRFFRSPVAKEKLDSIKSNLKIIDDIETTQATSMIVEEIQNQILEGLITEEEYQSNPTATIEKVVANMLKSNPNIPQA